MQTYELTEEDVHALTKISMQLGGLLDLLGIFLILYAKNHTDKSGFKNIGDRVKKILTPIREASENAEFAEKNMPE